MSRSLRIGAGQMGPIAREEPRQSAVARMIALLRQAAERRCDLIVFPELALTTFFPRWWFEDDDEADWYFEREMPNADTAPLFAAGRELGIGFSFGYAERVEQDGRMRHFNTSILVDKAGAIVGKYRKVHLPGHGDNQPWRPFQHLEKKYFEPGDLGFPVFDAFDAKLGMCICNDRRWPETYRVMGLQGVEVITLGYNTPIHNAEMARHDHLQPFHNALSMQAGAYQNGCYVVGVAKAGEEEDCMLLGQSMIVAPTGEIIAQASSLADELIVADCDMERCAEIKQHIFNFRAHRRPEHYAIIAAPNDD